MRPIRLSNWLLALIISPDHRPYHRPLVKPHEKHPALRGLRFGGEFLGALAIVAGHPYQHPPAAYGAVETLHFRRVVAAGEVVGKVRRGIFVRESTNLYRPPSTRLNGHRGLDHFQLHFGDSRLVNVEFARSGQRQIKNTAADKGDPDR